MPSDSEPRGTVCFGEFEVGLRAHELRRAGRRIRLQEKSFQVLIALLEQPGKVVAREELARHLWPSETFVDVEHGLNTAVRRLRAALGDSASEPRYIETLPRVGYRFVAPVSSLRHPTVPVVNRLAEDVAAALRRPIEPTRPPETSPTQPTDGGTGRRPRGRSWLLGLLGLAVIGAAVWRVERSTTSVDEPSRPPRVPAEARVLDPEAHASYLRGRYFWNLRTATGFRKALAQFERAVALEPAYAEAHAGLADTYGLMSISGYDLLPPAEAMPKARAAALRALELDESLAEAHASLAWVRYAYEWDFVAAQRGFRRAIELRPDYATAHQWYANLLCALGRLDQAQREIEIARALDPSSLVINNESAWPPYYARLFTAAEARHRATLELDPDYPIASLELGMTLAAAGRFREAIVEYDHYARLVGDNAEARAFLGHAYAGLGERQIAEELRRGLELSAERADMPAFAMAVVSIGLGDHERAFAWLEAGLAQRSDSLLYLGVEPLVDPLRTDPRFADLLRRVGLPASHDG